MRVWIPEATRARDKGTKPGEDTTASATPGESFVRGGFAPYPRP